MRGEYPIYFPVPKKGLIANVPPHEIPPDALDPDSFNVYFDIDGLMKARKGYAPAPPNGSGFNPKDYAIGMINFHNAADQHFYTVMQGINTWQWFDGMGWNNITDPANPTSGSFDLPARFAVLFQSAQSTVYGTNGRDQLRSWFPGQSTYQKVPMAPTRCRDLVVVGNRLVAAFTEETQLSGGLETFPYRIRWSAVNDGTTWPTLGFADLQGASKDMDFIVGVQALNQLNAAVYRENSIWVMAAVPGTDATAFEFEQASNTTGIAGPVCAAAIVPFGGIHYYFGSDGRIWVFDSINAYPISDVIDSEVIPIFNPGFLRRTSAAYLASQRHLWFFFPTFSPIEAQPTPWYSPPPLDFNVPSTAVVYDLRNQCFLPLQAFVWDNITTCAPITELITPTWLNWVPINSTWLQIPYGTWGGIQTTEQEGMYIATESGYAMRFFTSPTDNQKPIAYNATWGLRAAPVLTKNMKVSWLECYLQAIPETPPTTPSFVTGNLTFNEAIEADVVSFIQPMDINPTPIVSLAIALADQTTFYSMVEPGPTNPANLPMNWLQFSLNGQGNPTSGNFVFAGATLYMNLDDKPDYQSVGGVAAR